MDSAAEDVALPGDWTDAMDSRSRFGMKACSRWRNSWRNLSVRAISVSAALCMASAARRISVPGDGGLDGGLDGTSSGLSPSILRHVLPGLLDG